MELKVRNSKSVAIDIEGTMVDVFTPLIRLSEKRYGVTGIKEEIQSKGLENSFSAVPHKEIRSLVKEIWRDASSLPLIDDSIPTLLLSLNRQGRTVDIVTGSYADTEDIKKWLSYYSLYNDHMYHFDSGLSKLEVASDVIIEDSVSVAKQFADTGRSAVFIRRWWNIYQRDTLVNNPNVLQVDSWDALARLFEIEEMQVKMSIVNTTGLLKLKNTKAKLFKPKQSK